MNQIGLSLITKLRYSAQGFFLHSGVAETLRQTVTLISNPQSETRSPSFNFIVISGSPKVGKSHAAIWLQGELSKCSSHVKLLEYGELSPWFRSAETEKTVKGDSVLIVDDIHLYLKQLNPSDFGEFVSLVELFKRQSASVVFFLDPDAPLTNLDGHVLSRLNSAVRLDLHRPTDEEMEALIALMARQRGLSLSTRKVSYLARRLGRDVQSVEVYLNRLYNLSQVVDQPFDLRLLGDAIEKRHF